MTITFFNLNVNGIRAFLKKKIVDENGELTTNFEDFIKSKNYTIVALQETKVNGKCQDLLDSILPEYKYRYHTFTKNSRSGVSVFSKIKPKNIVYDIGIDESIDKSKFKGRCIELEFDNFYFVSVYQPNAGQNLKSLTFRTTEWDPTFGEFVQKLINKKEVIICGDLNVIQNPLGTYNYKAQRNKLAGVTDIEMLNFTMLLNKGLFNSAFYKDKDSVVYTYFSYLFKARQNNKGMTIDYFLTTKDLLKKITHFSVLDNIYGSDHLPLSLSLKM